MRSLPDLQAAFGAALAEGARVQAILGQLRGSSEQAAAGLAVYRGNVYGNLAQALAGAYPVVEALLGHEFFDATAREYARRHTSASGDLNEYGGALAEFVEQFPHTQDLPYLPDLARLEWLVHRAHYAADAAPLDLRRIAALSADAHAALRPVLAAGCALMESAWPVGRLWQAHRAPGSIELASVLAAGGERLLVHRSDWDAQVSALQPGEYVFLRSAAGGGTLDEALDAGAAAEAGFDSGAVLARWVHAGVVVELAP